MVILGYSHTAILPLFPLRYKPACSLPLPILCPTFFLFKTKTTTFSLCCLYTLECVPICWNMANLPGATDLKKTDSPFPRCHQLSTAPQLVAEGSQAPPHSLLEIHWLDLLQTELLPEFLSVGVLSCFEDTVTWWDSLTSAPQSFWPLICGEGQCAVSSPYPSFWGTSLNRATVGPSWQSHSLSLQRAVDLHIFKGWFQWCESENILLNSDWKTSGLWLAVASAYISIAVYLSWIYDCSFVFPFLCVLCPF